MSFSKPFFNSKPGGRKLPYPDEISETEYRSLHWTQQLLIRPLGSRTRRVYEQGDFDTRIDMFDDNEIVDKEIT